MHNKPGNRPRGTFTRAQAGNVKIMAVLRNPGQPNPVELELESGLNGRQLAERLWNYSGEVWDGVYYSPTLAALKKDAHWLLELPESECSKHFLFTNLVRCTTTDNQTPNAEAIRIGADWLQIEIDLWKPQFVIAYGNDVAKSMRKYDMHFDAKMPSPKALGKWLNQECRKAHIAQIRQHLYS